jgi:hypothetical protein
LDAVPVGCLPGIRASWVNDGACDDATNSLARQFNALLRLEMASATAAAMPGLEYSIASVYNIISDMFSNLQQDGSFSLHPDAIKHHLYSFNSFY